MRRSPFLAPRRPLLLAALLAFSVLANPLGATWSIVCVDRATREVGVATATCLVNFDIKIGVPVITVGKGAAAAQSFLDVTGANRRLINTRFLTTSSTPAQILAALANSSGHQTRQYGIVNFHGAPVTFTGAQAGLAASGVVGEIGEILYAIQGNVLTGDEVVLAAEAAFRNTKGDMGQRMLAAMEGARSLGGDGRCSCNPNDATACGVPPPSFRKTAHVGAVVLARMGDTDGVCGANQGCANGSYYLDLNVVNGVPQPDPVFTLQKSYENWRRRHMGRVDGIHSRAEVKGLPADGSSERTALVELRDVDGNRILHGGATLEVTPADGAAPLTEVGPVEDLGDGRYAFTLRAGRQPGVERLAVRVTDTLASNPSDVVTATLWPYLEVPVVTTGLHAGLETVGSSSGGRIPFVLNQPERPGASYALVATLASRLDHPKAAAGFPLRIRQSPFFPAAPLRLDELGWDAPVLEVSPGSFADLVGRRVEVAGFVLDGQPLATNRVSFEIVP